VEQGSRQDLGNIKIFQESAGRLKVGLHLRRRRGRRDFVNKNAGDTPWEQERSLAKFVSQQRYLGPMRSSFLVVPGWVAVIWRQLAKGSIVSVNLSAPQEDLCSN